MCQQNNARFHPHFHSLRFEDAEAVYGYPSAVTLYEACVVNDASPLAFPATFPVKIMGRDEPGFHEVVAEIFARHVAPLSELPVKKQSSKEGRFVSITVTIQAKSREQLDALYRDLSAHHLVLMAL